MQPALISRRILKLKCKWQLVVLNERQRRGNSMPVVGVFCLVQ